MTSRMSHSSLFLIAGYLLLVCTRNTYGESLQPSSASIPSSFPSPPPVSISPRTSTNPNKNYPLVDIKEERITMVLTGVEPLDQLSVDWYQQQTSAYIQFYYNGPDADGKRHLRGSNYQRKLAVQDVIFDTSVTVNVTTTDPQYDSQSTTSQKNRKRSLQESSIVTITYDQQMSFRYTDNTYSLENISQDTSIMAQLIQDPFSTIVKRKAYIAFLQDPIIPAAQVFSNLVKLSPPVLFEKKISLVAIISGIAGGVVFIILMIILGCWWKKKKSGKNDLYIDPADYDHRYRKNDERALQNGGNPGSQIQLANLREDVSTLDDPPIRHGIFGDGSIAGYGNQSVISGDPDYTPNYAGAGASTASSVGGTLGDATRQSTHFSGGDSLMTPAIHTLAENQSVFDEQSFEAHLRNGQQKEEIIEIYAPAGKLGVVIDTPNSGAPVVHNIKDTCPVADKLKVGDKLIAVDDEDVRQMTAVKVSRLISQKSGNPTRKFTISRYV